MDTFYARRPARLFGKNFEEAVVNTQVSPILDQHLMCAAFEKPIQLPDDQQWFGDEIGGVCERSLVKASATCYLCPQHLLPNPAMNFPIRCANSETIRLLHVSTKEVLEELEIARALFHLYEGAVYFHEGSTFMVEYADLQHKKEAWLRPCAVDYITKQRDYTNADGMGVSKSLALESGGAQSSCCYYGDVRGNWIRPVVPTDLTD